MHAIAQPCRDTERTPLAVSLSVLLHGMVALGLVAYFWTHSPKAPPPSQTMMIFPAPAAEATSPAGPTAEESHSQPTQLPNIISPPVQIQTPPTLPTPPAPPTPPVPTPPPPKPNPLPPKTTTPPPPSNRGQTPPKPAPPKPATYTYSDYMRAHPQATAQPATAANTSTARGPATKPITVGIDSSSVLSGVARIGDHPSGPVVGPATPGQQDVYDYIQMLVARLKAAFTPPPGVAGLQAEVSLTIDAEGRVVARKITGRSGNEKFDAAVQMALDSLTQVDRPPPSGVETTYPFTYKPDRS